MPNTPRPSHEEEIQAAALGADDIYFPIGDAIDADSWDLLLNSSPFIGQQMTDSFTIDYHLHLAGERLKEIEDRQAPLREADLAYVDEHIRVLQNGLEENGNILLSGSCDQVGSPAQQQHLRAILDHRDVIAEQVKRCLHCPHREAHQG